MAAAVEIHATEVSTAARRINRGANRLGFVPAISSSRSPIRPLGFGKSDGRKGPAISYNSDCAHSVDATAAACATFTPECATF